MEELKFLVELQEKDSEISRLRGEAERIPQEIDTLDKRLGESRARVGSLRETQREALKKRRQRENDLADVQGRQDKLRQGLHAIKTNRDYTAALQQIENYKDEIGKLEEAILELMEEGERAERELAEREEELEEEEEVVTGGQALLRRELAEVEENLGRCEAERAAIAGRVPGGLLARYERISAHTHGVAVVPVTNGVCGGCYRRLPPQLALEVRAERELLSCQFCGRVLYARIEESPAEESPAWE